MTRTAVHNPYLEEFLGLSGGYERPEEQDLCSWETARNRSELVSRYSWAIPNQEALDTLAGLGPLVEIGAGGGYWAHLLRQMGCDVLAFDASPPPHLNQWVKRLWSEVECGHWTPPMRHPDRTLFLCWPSYGGEHTLRALQVHHMAGGSRLVYVGEDAWGCCADDGFFDFRDEHYQEVNRVWIPRWWGLRDDLTVWERKR